VQNNHIPVLKSNGKEITAVTAIMSGHKACSANNCSWSHNQWPSVRKWSCYLLDYIMRPASLHAACTQGTWVTAAIPERYLPSHDSREVSICCPCLVWSLHSGAQLLALQILELEAWKLLTDTWCFKTCAEANKQLFRKLINYANHALQWVIPPATTVSQRRCNLRSRRHTF